MGFLRRMLGGGDKSADVGADRTESDREAGADEPEEPALDDDAFERARELELLRGEQERLDELTQRQLRYARYAWQPPAQGGERRSDDAESSG